MKKKKAIIILVMIIIPIICTLYSCGKQPEKILCYSAKTEFVFGEQFVIGKDISLLLKYSDDSTSELSTRNLIYDDESGIATNDIIVVDYSAYEPLAVGRYTIYIRYAKDTNIYASYKVNVLSRDTEYSVYGYSGIYDGSPKTIYMNLPADESIAVRYSLDGETYNIENCPSFKDVGEYTIYYEIARNGFTTYYGESKIKIEPAALSIKVKDSSVIYGQEFDLTQCEIEVSGLLGDETAEENLTGQGVFETNYKVGDNTGRYEITLTGYESKNYEISYVKGNLEVLRAENELSVTAEDITYGDNLKPEVIYCLSGEPAMIYEYSVSGREQYTRIKPTDAGEYDIRCICQQSQNYNEVTEYIRGVKINKATLVVIPAGATLYYSEELDTSKLSCSFNGFKFDDDVTCLSGEIVYQTNYKAGDSVGIYDITVSGYISSNYNIVYRSGMLTVNKIRNPLTLTFPVKIYDSYKIEPIIQNNVTGLEIAYKYQLNGSEEIIEGLPYHAGTYNIYIYQAESENYSEYSVTHNGITINQKQVRLIWGTIEFYYNGQAHCPTVEIERDDIISGDEVTISSYTLTDAIVASTEPYEAYCSELSNADYKLPENKRCLFWIHKMGVESPKVADAVYDGNHHKAGVADNEIYTVYKNDGGVNAAKYTVVLLLRDTNNYSWTTTSIYQGIEGTFEFKFTILRAENEIKDFAMEDWDYGEGVKSPTYKVKFESEDRKIIEYRKKGETTFTQTAPEKVGEYEVRMTIYASQNYETVISEIIGFRINKVPAKYTYIDIFNVEIDTYAKDLILPQDEVGEWSYNGSNDYKFDKQGIVAVPVIFTPAEEYQEGYDIVETMIYVNVVSGLGDLIEFENSYVLISDIIFTISMQEGETAYFRPILTGYATNATITYSSTPDGEYKSTTDLIISKENIGVHTIYIRIDLDGFTSLFLHRTITITE